MKLDKINLIFKTGLMGLFLFLLPVAQYADAQADLQNRLDPKALYDEMMSSPGKYDYKGILTYEQGGHLQSFEVQSEVSGGLIDQKLELLNGPQTSHYFSFDASCEKRSSLAANELSAYYNFYSRGETRVAGYEGTEIVLLPIDKYRNGYQYVIDNISKLMLRSMTLTPDRRMIERLQFAQLDYRAYLPASNAVSDPSEQEPSAEIESSVETEPSDVNSAEKTVEASEQAAEQPHKIGCDQLSIENGWVAGWLPSGFVILDSKLEGGRAVLVYSDGISTFSIFIDAVIESFLPPSNAQRGATTVYINYLSDQSSTYLVSIIGEIPLATADRVMSSLRRK